MKIIIFGLGNFGMSLALSLTETGNEVIGVDKQMDKINLIKDKISHAVCMDSTNEFAYESLPLKDADKVVVGIGENEFFVASDASPFVEFTKEAVYLEEGHMASISLEAGIDIRTIKENTRIEPAIQELRLNLEQIEKGGYEHFMLKEIFEQPKSILDTMRGRLLADEGIIKMAGIWDHLERLTNAERIIIIACGTSWHAGLNG